MGKLILSETFYCLCNLKVEQGHKIVQKISDFLGFGRFLQARRIMLQYIPPYVKTEKLVKLPITLSTCSIGNQMNVESLTELIWLISTSIYTQ